MNNVNYKFLDIVEQIEESACKAHETSVEYMFLEFSSPKDSEGEIAKAKTNRIY